MTDIGQEISADYLQITKSPNDVGLLLLLLYLLRLHRY